MVSPCAKAADETARAGTLPLSPGIRHPERRKRRTMLRDRATEAMPSFTR
jgi:hypothetical protein